MILVLNFLTGRSCFLRSTGRSSKLPRVGVGLLAGSGSGMDSESDGIEIGRGFRMALFFRRGRRISSGRMGSSASGSIV